MHWVMREYANQDAIPKAALMHFLHQEYEVGCMTWQCACANPGYAGRHLSAFTNPLSYNLQGLDGCEISPTSTFPAQQIFPSLLGERKLQWPCATRSPAA